MTAPAVIRDIGLLQFTKTYAAIEAANLLNLTANMHRWKFSALAAAAFVSAALSSTDAAALALGSIRVHSALGENLRADIAIAQITPAEMDSLLANVASPEIFRAQGMDYSAAARSIAVELKRNTDGTAQLQLSSSAPITDPFLDLVLQTNWHNGHLVRSYTLLLDPPVSTRSAASSNASPIAPQITPPPATAAVTGRTYSSSATPGAPAVARPTVAATTPAPTASKPATVVAAVPDAAESVTIRAGQTAGQVASANRIPDVSLDQMLVAMLRSNPDAFINGNVNRIRAGTVVQMPSREQALETSAPEARRIVAAQSRDFNTYRRSLASKAPTAQVQAADRSSSGQVQAHVADTSSAATTPDKLTLSKAAVQNAAAHEQKLAEQKQAQDQSERLNELQRNLTELNQIAQSSTTPAPTPATTAAEAEAEAEAAAPQAPEVSNTAPSTPAVEVIAPVLAQATTPEPLAENPATPEPPAAAAAAAAEPVAAAAAEPVAPVEPVATAQPAPRVKQAKPASPSFIPAPAAPPTLLERLQENPLIPAGSAALALLLGLLGYRFWKKRSATTAEQDPALGDSQLHADSFFGGSGGQQVDTNSAESEGATTMAYSPSQLDGGGDVDPVAEADVYLAYGRDVQAEEILKEAQRNYPQRLAVHMKLAEIYAKRHDLKALESTARAMQDISSSDSADWQRVIAMGRSLDPSNPLYTASDSPESSNKATTSFADALQNAKPVAGAAAVVAAGATATQGLPDLDLNLDLDLPGGLADSQPVAAPVNPPKAAPSLPSDEAFAALNPKSSLDSQLDLSVPSPTDNPPTLVADTVMPDDITIDISGADGLDFDLSNFNINEAAPAPTALAEADKAQESPNDAPNEVFDLGADLSFDVEPTAPAVDKPATPASDISSDVSTTSQSASGLDFDLGSLDVGPDSDDFAAAASQSGQNDAQDALTTKLDLAQEFNAIGDSEGARALIEEVLAEASGTQKARAQKMLSEID